MTVSLDGVITDLKIRIQGMLSDGAGALVVTSAFRTRAEQQHLYDLFLAGKGSPANKPGTSKHEIGEAVDVECDSSHNAIRAELVKKWGLITPHKEELWHMELDPNRKSLNTPQEVAQMINHPAVAIVPTHSGIGYYIIASDGGVFTFGDAQFFGSMGGQNLAAPIANAALTPSGLGYWLLGADGGVFAFGDAIFCETFDGKKGTDFIR